MIVTDHFVYIHTSRSAGTFLNKLIMENVPGARMIQYHGHLADLPVRFEHLPVIGIVRNPWDWYVSMHFDYKRKQQYIFQMLSRNGTMTFDETLTRYLNLGDGSDASNRLLKMVARAAPQQIDASTPPRRRNPGLCTGDFENYPANVGYYSWLFKLMYATDRDPEIHIGRFENLVPEVRRLFEITGTPITPAIDRYLEENKALNTSHRPSVYADRYSPEMRDLVAERDHYIIEQFGYTFHVDEYDSKYPKPNYFRDLGSVDVTALRKRVAAIPEADWDGENEEKPNDFTQLADARHIVFRFVDEFVNVYKYHDRPLWEEWKDDLLPIMEQSAKQLGYAEYCFPRVMLARLKAGGKIHPHSDQTASHYIHKIHVPLETSPGTMFHVGDQVRNIKVGEVVEVNNKRVHAVDNDGDIDRIHLIFECYNMEDYGKAVGS